MAVTSIVTPTTPIIPRTSRVVNISSRSNSNIVNILSSILTSVKKIESIVSSRSILQKKQIDQTRRSNITTTRIKQEKEAETPKLTNPFKFLKGALPKTGFLDSLRNFILYTFMGYAFTKLYPLLPKVLSTLKSVEPVIKFTEKFVGTVFNNFVSAIDFGYKQYDQVRSLARQVGGEKFEKQFDDLSSNLNKFLNLAIIVGLTIAGSGAVGGGGGKKLPTRVGPGAGETRPRPGMGGRPRVTTSGGGRAGGIDLRNPLRGRPRITTGVGGRAATKLFGKGVGKIVGKVPIVGPIIDFLVSTLIFKERPERAGAGAVGAAVGAALGSIPVLIPFGGPIWGGLLGDIIGRSLYDAVVGMKEQPVQKTARGGQVTRGGRSVSSPVKRTVKRPPKRLQQFKQQKPQPGRDVGGLNQIKKVFPSPNDQKKKNPLRALQRTSELLNRSRDPLFGGVMVATANLQLGQKPDPQLKQEIKNNFAALIDNAITAQTAKDVNQIGRSIVTAAEGGIIPASRSLNVGPTIGQKIGDIIATSYQNTINQRTNEIFNNLRREMGLLKMEEEISPPGGGGEGGGIDQGLGSKAGGSPELREEVIKAAAQLGIDAPSLLGAILAESGGDPSRTNQFGRTGLIQFCPGPHSGQAVIGKSGDELRRMSIRQQMPYVIKYLKAVGVKPGMTGFDIYSAIHAGRPGGNLTDANGVTTRGYYESNVKPLIDKARAERRTIAGPGVITADKIYPLSSGQGRDVSGEPGIDFTYKGGKTLALYPGKVVDIGTAGNYGNYVLVESIDPNNGKKFTILYAHFGNGKISVRKGDIVRAGAPLGDQPNANKRGFFTGTGSGEHTSADFYEPDGRTKYSNANKLINQVLNSFAGNNPYPTQIQSETPTPTPGQAQPPASRPKTVNIGGMLWTKKSDGNWVNQFGNAITNAELNQKLLEQKNKDKPKPLKPQQNKPWWDIFGTQSKMNIPTQIQPQTAKAQFTPLPIIQPNIARDDIASSPETIVNTHIIAMTKVETT